MKRAVLCVLGLGLLAASCTAMKPNISAIQHDTISVQSRVMPFLSAVEEARRVKMVDDEARRGCNLYDRQVSQQVSKRCIEHSQGLLRSCLVEEFPFACTPSAS